MLAFSRLERIEIGSYQVSTAFHVLLNGCDCQQQSTLRDNNGGRSQHKCLL